MSKETVAILGAGNMGTAMAKVIAENGYTVKLWNYEGDLDPLREIEQFAENKKYLPGVKLPKNVVATYAISDALKSSKVILFVVSSGAMESIMQAALPHITSDMILVDVSKGFHPRTNEMIPTMMKKMLGRKKASIVALTGPAVAKQIVEGHPAVLVAASSSLASCKNVQKVLGSANMKVLLGTDMVGGEVVQSFKNVYAIGLGMAQGLGLAFNTQAILFTVALQEMALLNKKMGGRPETVYGFAGLGDFLTTAMSPEGRNRRFGECLGQGLCKTDATVEVKQTVEGVSATLCLKKIARKQKLNLPFALAIDSVIEGKLSPQKAIDGLLKKIK
jgi:glycerol-3-phosphate dehydrogenase (NAD(P)+)